MTEVVVPSVLPQHDVGISTAGRVPLSPRAAWSRRSELSSGLVLVDPRDQLVGSVVVCICACTFLTQRDGEPMLTMALFMTVMTTSTCVVARGVLVQ